MLVTVRRVVIPEEIEDFDPKVDPSTYDYDYVRIEVSGGHVVEPVIYGGYDCRGMDAARGWVNGFRHGCKAFRGIDIEVKWINSYDLNRELLDWTPPT